MLSDKIVVLFFLFYFNLKDYAVLKLKGLGADFLRAVPAALGCLGGEGRTSMSSSTAAAGAGRFFGDILAGF